MQTQARKITAPFLALAFGGCLLGSAAGVRAQQPFVPTAPAVSEASPAPAPVAFSFQLARVAQSNAGVQSFYTLRATQPADSKQTGQKIRLTVDRTTPQGTTTRQLTLNTGKRKTVTELCATLRGIFIKYQSTRTGAVGSEVGKIGDLKYGGEIRFVVDSPEFLRYDMQTEGEEDHSTKLSADEVSNLIALLGEAIDPQRR